MLPYYSSKTHTHCYVYPRNGDTYEKNEAEFMIDTLKKFSAVVFVFCEILLDKGALENLIKKIF
jgi:hypothetical protein